MRDHVRMGAAVALALCLSASGAGVARGQPSVKRTLDLAESSAELGFGATVVGSGGDLSTTFLGAVLTVQGSHFRPLAAVFQLGVGAGMGDDPADPDETRVRAQGFAALGLRFRPLALLSGSPRPIDFFVGPLVGTLFDHGVVYCSASAELGIAYRRGRLRLSVSAHFGWADIMHQAAPATLKADYSAGGVLSAGLAF